MATSHVPVLRIGSDMANIDITWDIDGVLTPKVSVAGMFEVIAARTIEDSGTFWTWDGKVSISPATCNASALTRTSAIHGSNGSMDVVLCDRQ